MMRGSIIGYDLNEKNCQISFYSEELHEPQTMEIAADNYQIPLAIGNKGGMWVYGREARSLAAKKQGFTVSNILKRALNQEKVRLGEDIYEAVWLLAKFIELSLKQFKRIDYITFTVTGMGVDIDKMLKGIGQRMGVQRDCIYVQDYKESFCHYMCYQPKELWQFEAALFHCDKDEMKAFMLRKLNTGRRVGVNTFVTVDEVANAHMDELRAVYPVLNVDKAKEADARFKMFIEGVFEKKLVSSVFLTDDGFENNWYSASLKVLCNGRRAFLGNNMYSKGACYTSFQKYTGLLEGPIYLDETKMTSQISLRMRVGGKEQWYPVVCWGSRWYEADTKIEVLLEDTQDIEIHIESLATGELDVVTVPMKGVPARKNYSVRLQIQVLFLDENTCQITFKDVGFGEMFRETEFQIEKMIHLGGNHGQFNSLS